MTQRAGSLAGTQYPAVPRHRWAGPYAGQCTGPLVQRYGCRAAPAHGERTGRTRSIRRPAP